MGHDPVLVRQPVKRAAYTDRSAYLQTRSENTSAIYHYADKVQFLQLMISPLLGKFIPQLFIVAIEEIKHGTLAQRWFDGCSTPAKADDTGCITSISGALIAGRSGKGG